MISEGYSFIFWLIIIFILFEALLNFILDRRNSQSWLLPIPEILKDVYNQEQYTKAQKYHAESERLAAISSLFGIILTLGFLIFKGFAFVYLWIGTLVDSELLQILLFFGFFMIVSDIISLPFSLYSTFVIEEKYGFNKMSLKTFILDKIKGYALGILIGGLLLSAFVWFYQNTGQLFWIYAWILFTVFSVFMAMFYTSWIVPIFNQLRPLEEGNLRTKIEEFAAKVQFPLTNIFVIDGSKRSTKANAYFSGLGSKKTIVLYDTLIAEHSEDELVAILAHEVGHYKLKHIQKSLAIGILQMGIVLFVLSWAVSFPQLTSALGLESNKPVFALGLIAFSMLYAPISTLTGLLMNIYSRKNEFEADNYAKENTGSGVFLISALKKLSSNNLSNLNPDKWYVFFNYSHPPLKNRIEKLL
ncbi:MAG: M48 family metallopeptidase [Chitinophagales bacterium]|nr:M48 family metallopeptidase [Chitinophagales bacterium]HMU99303.1 M48 family metallopeptidase [Chitinophagales bacterium]HMV03893.1 M48 family metallopeptidase [Chitinophagales bacterium]HMY43662.1 M48 family metallopeptidase [Chitinophagales bacterium]HNB39828.1 M48 family metallopeptidase [Chitinophagales bacterium]